VDDGVRLQLAAMGKSPAAHIARMRLRAVGETAVERELTDGDWTFLADTRSAKHSARARHDGVALAIVAVFADRRLERQIVWGARRAGVGVSLHVLTEIRFGSKRHAADFTRAQSSRIRA